MKNFKKYYQIPACPEEVYLAMTKAQSIKLWTGAEVEFTEEPGTEFSFWDGDIVGKNLEFEYGKKIVQQWYFGEESEPSIVTIKLHEDKRGTSLEFAQTNIPDEDFEDFTQGLDEYYLGGLLDFFED
ncbi:Activator of Hsp90 ATPase homolog 1-like protein [Pedobacter sp. ok626]|uniref:SRPBCC domain-containing protein n=1 Tax=Pedobacter sp. ok626 TaxID=1761882 RepID=UPI000887B11F|nr:SRPBCC domain-containing protein [Pedobacter sp. ok626]SDJ53017.1 Activator of Hsp90 ATPase homolog 1-like protein [Pedobacter sp. ok626]